MSLVNVTFVTFTKCHTVKLYVESYLLNSNLQLDHEVLELHPALGHPVFTECNERICEFKDIDPK